MISTKMRTIAAGALVLGLAAWDLGGSAEAGRRRDRASARNKAACEKYCRKTVGCDWCRSWRGCGRRYESMKRFGGYGRNYYACKRRVTKLLMGREKRHAGKVYAINIPGKRGGSELSLAEAKRLVRRYRWIHVNASAKDRSGAKYNATMLSREVGSPLLLVFMTRGLFDGSRNRYAAAFVRNLGALAAHAIADGKTLLVSARSYGNSQTLRVLRRFANSPRILFTGHCPAFGAFGNKWSANVKRFHEDVRRTRVKYCMISSTGDKYTWRSGGACIRSRGKVRGDPKVCAAIDRNRRNVKVYTIAKADHDNAEYIQHGVIRRMRECVRHFGFQNKLAGRVVFGGRARRR